jgi:hypothetical protein
MPEGDAGEDSITVQHSHAHEALRRWTAASTIQAHWRARTIATQDVGGAAVAELRARHKLRNCSRKAAGKVTLIMERLAALCVGVAEQARHHEVADAVAWFEVRGAASIVVADVLPFVKWADSATPQAELVRFLAPVTAPSSIGAKAIEASLAPTIAGVFLRSVPLQVAVACIWTSSVIIALLILFEVRSAWWLSLFVSLSWPGIVCYTASLNKVVPKRLSKTFQTIFVGVNTSVMFGTFCFLRRYQPAKIAALTIFLAFGLTRYMDGYPEIGRRAASAFSWQGSSSSPSYISYRRASPSTGCSSRISRLN